MGNMKILLSVTVIVMLTLSIGVAWADEGTMNDTIVDMGTVMTIEDPGWFRFGPGGELGRIFAEYGPQYAPILKLSDYDNPPRIQFQQEGTGTESDPQYRAWIGMAMDKSNNLAIIGDNVGIGTTEPFTKLHIVTAEGADHEGYDNPWLGGQHIEVAATKMWGLSDLHGMLCTWNTDSLFIGQKNEGDNRKDAIIAFGDNTDDSLRFMFAPHGNPPPVPKELMRITGKGNVNVYGPSFSVSGTKNFLIDHPLDPEHKELIHSTLEGPEAGVFYRGEAQLSGGEATVMLPDYFEALTRKESRTVLLTPKFEGDEQVSMLAVAFFAPPGDFFYPRGFTYGLNCRVTVNKNHKQNPRVQLLSPRDSSNHNPPLIVC